MPLSTLIKLLRMGDAAFIIPRMRLRPYIGRARAGQAPPLRNIIRNIIRTDCLLYRAPQDWPARASHACTLDIYLATRATRYSQGTDHQPSQSLRQRLLAAGHAPLPGQVQQFPAGYSFHRHLEAFSSDPE